MGIKMEKLNSIYSTTTIVSMQNEFKSSDDVSVLRVRWVFWLRTFEHIFEDGQIDW